MKEKILEVKNLEVSFKTYAGISHAVRGIDFNLHKGETLAIVGESGCGKTVSSKAIMRLLPESNTLINENSEVLFHGEDLLKKSENSEHFGGPEETRTLDLSDANRTLSQLSYRPIFMNFLRANRVAPA